MPADLQRVWRDHLEGLRRWAIQATLAAYRDVVRGELTLLHAGFLYLLGIEVGA